MSAWLCSNAHISAIVSAVGVTGPAATILGRSLLLENMLSLEARYRTPVNVEALAAYEYDAPRMPFSPVETIKLIRSYHYQSSEHDAWNASTARAFCTALENEVRQTLPIFQRKSEARDLPGYDAAPWSLD